MPKFAVDVSIAGKLTIDVEADDENEAYDKATDALFCVLDGGNIEHEFEFRELDEVRPIAEDLDAEEELPSP